MCIEQYSFYFELIFFFNKRVLKLNYSILYLSISFTRIYFIFIKPLKTRVVQTKDYFWLSIFARTVNFREYSSRGRYICMCNVQSVSCELPVVCIGGTSYTSCLYGLLNYFPRWKFDFVLSSHVCITDQLGDYRQIKLFEFPA